MPFRSSFDCLWCGSHHEVRTDEDLEGWASLCPECMGRVDDNGFLRARLRAALRERGGGSGQAASGEAPVSVAAPASVAAPTAPVAVEAPVAVASPSAHDDWYLRQGRFTRGPIIDEPWQMELDEATRWLDSVPMSGVIVELAPGAGWWSTLLASKGELWLFDSDEAALEQARKRLVAHGLLAHLHARDPLGKPDREADVVFSSYLLAAALDADALRQRLRVVREWLKPGGTFVFVEARGAADATDTPEVDGVGPIDGPGGLMRPRTSDELRAALAEVGLDAVELAETHSAFLLGRATPIAPASVHSGS